VTLRPVALVTGAGRRVGRAIAIHLASRGHDVAIHFHSSEDEAREVASLCAAEGASAELFQADLADAASAETLVQRVVAAFGRLDVLVNSAAEMVSLPVATVTPAQWDHVFALNVRAPFFLSLAAFRAMSEGGAIVNLADHLAEEVTVTLVPHAISKAAIVSMTQQLAVRFAPNVRVNAVQPGAVLPPEDWPDDARARFIANTPLKRLGTPEDVAAAVEYLIRATFVTGHVLVVDGGRRLA